MKNTEIKIKIAKSTSQPVKVSTGLRRQGNALSSVFFNLALEKIVMNMSKYIWRPYTLGQSMILCRWHCYFWRQHGDGERDSVRK